jgi:hypothetical protein
MFERSYVSDFVVKKVIFKKLNIFNKKKFCTNNKNSYDLGRHLFFKI